jgi:hypothetical protein
MSKILPSETSPTSHYIAKSISLVLRSKIHHGRRGRSSNSYRSSWVLVVKNFFIKYPRHPTYLDHQTQTGVLREFSEIPSNAIDVNVFRKRIQRFFTCSRL